MKNAVAQRGKNPLLPYLCFVFIGSICTSVLADADEDRHVEQPNTLFQLQSFQLQALAKAIGYHARLASHGNPHELRLLRESRDAFDKVLKNLSLTFEKSTTRHGILYYTDYRAVRIRWDIIRGKIDEVLSRQSALLALPDQTQRIRVSTDRLMPVLDELVEIGSMHGVRADWLYVATRQSALSQRAAKNIILFALAESDQGVSLAQAGKDVKLLTATQARLRELMPPVASAKLDESGAIIEEINRPVADILNAAPELYRAQLAAQVIFEQSGPLEALCRKLAENFRDPH
jgi:hypothetical protein